MAVSLTRDHMKRLRVAASDQVRSAERSGTSEFCHVANGEVFMPATGVCVWCATDHSFASRLTNRQLESMRLVALGNTRKQIAVTLGSSETTVANDWRDVRRALQARTTAQAVAMLVREDSI